jgi:hypothetical protein
MTFEVPVKDSSQVKKVIPAGDQERLRAGRTDKRK